MIPAVLIYAFAPDGRVLLIHRNTRGQARDYHSGKWNGLGGKLEPGESPLEGARREFSEEAGVALTEGAFECAGWIQFPLFKAHKGEDWWVTVFRARLSAAEAARVRVANEPAADPEGELHWVEPARVLDLPLWAGDQLFLPQVLRGESVAGTIWYDGELVVRSQWI